MQNNSCCRIIGNFRFILGDLLDNLKGCLIVCNFSFNFEAFTLDVEAYYVLASSCIVDIYGLFSKNKYYINTFMTNVEWHIFFLTSIFIIPLNILRCSPPNQIFVSLSERNICPIYKIFLDLPLSWNNIFVIKIMNFVSLVNYLKKWKKMNIIRWFHFANIPLFYI